MNTRRIVFERALTPAGWQDGVAIDIGPDGLIVSVEANSTAKATIRGLAIPGVFNLHSHAFQRGFAGVGERSAGADLFWSWRDIMYRFANKLTPDDVEVIAAQAFLEMVEAGFTGVTEFHYLHHQPNGSPYANPAELSHRVISAAETVGLRLTLLPVFYAHGGADGRAPDEGQKRFINGIDSFMALHEAASKAMSGSAKCRIGLALHSLRAATLHEIKTLLPVAQNSPIHIHAAEQTREIDEVTTALGARPVEILLDKIGLDRRWCLIHCTHMTPDETRRLAQSQAVAGLCPITEANLGDGIFEGVAYASEGGRFGVGSDSNIRLSLADELRTLEYSQRLRDMARNRMAIPGFGTGRALLDTARQGGAQAAGWAEAKLDVGAPADIIVLDTTHPALLGRQDDDALNGWIFSADNAAIADVMISGQHLVRAGRHRLREKIRARFSAVMQRLATG
jgi:formimidoylglutamate deiminase